MVVSTRLPAPLVDAAPVPDQRRLRLVVAATTAFVLVIMGFVVFHAYLSVRHVRVVGATRTSPTVIAMAAGLHGSMLTVDTGRAAAHVELIPWIATVSVRRHWPSTVVITVTERTPVALVGSSSGVMQVDARGRVLGPADGQVILPVVALAPGISANPIGSPGSQIDAVYAPGIATAAAFTPSLAPRVTGITVASDATVAVGLVTKGSVSLGSAVDLGEKIADIVALLDHGAVGAGTVDLTVPAAPVVTGGP
jgi:cell division protein FtsQ